MGPSSSLRIRINQALGLQMQTVTILPMPILSMTWTFSNRVHLRREKEREREKINNSERRSHGDVVACLVHFSSTLTVLSLIVVIRPSFITSGFKSKFNFIYFFFVRFIFFYYMAKKTFMTSHAFFIFVFNFVN